LYLCLGLHSGLFHSVFPTKTLYAFRFSVICVLHVLPISSSLTWSCIFDKEYKLWSSSLCSFLQPPLILWLILTTEYPWCLWMPSFCQLQLSDWYTVTELEGVYLEWWCFFFDTYSHTFQLK
jgi:hypothetical protein